VLRDLPGVARVDPRVRRAERVTDVGTTCSRPSRWLAESPTCCRRRCPATSQTRPHRRGGEDRCRRAARARASARIAATVLAASLVPTTIAAHRLAETTRRCGQPAAPFRQELSILGGLLIAAGDTAGRAIARLAGRSAADRASVRVHDVAAANLLAGAQTRGVGTGGVAQPLTPIRTQRDVRTHGLWLPARRRPECALVGR